MESRRGLKIPSLRGKLGLAAFAALLATAIVTVLLLLTASAANNVIDTARQSQERSRVYLQLQSAATDFQHASFAAIRDPDSLVQRRVTETRTRMENLLADVNRLPTGDATDMAANQRIEGQIVNLIAHFDRSDELIERVNRQWRTAGGSAAMREANLISAPIYTLRETLLAEITRGDSKVAAATQDAQDLIANAVLASLVALVLALCSSLIVMVLLQTRLRPGMAKLEDGAKAFERGEMDHRIELSGNDELVSLSGAFNSMAQTISDKCDALSEVTDGLEETVAERTAALEKANAELSVGDERRRAFFAEISHELRTPLTVIRGEAQVAQRISTDQDPELHGTFDRILEQTQLLTRMVNDLFLIARAQAGGLPLDRKVLNLRDIARCVTGDFANLAEANGGKIRLSKGGDVFVNVDADRVKRALLALIENAMVHCPQGVHIDIEVTADDEFATICVHDNGPGMDFGNSDRLFERFRRGTTEARGSGLGLSLVSALATAHGGKASLRAGMAGGTCASISFPVAQQHREVA